MAISKLKMILGLVIIGISLNSFGNQRADILEGFNWYNEKPPTPKEKPEQVKKTPAAPVVQKESKELPDYERNIRALQKQREQAHRRALDQPTQDNLIAEMRVEKEMMRKSRVYAERRVIVASLDSESTNMKDHSNVLHRRVQDEIDDKDNFKNFAKLSESWGLVVQVSEDCPHCHAFAPIIRGFSEKYGFQLLATSKNGQDFLGIEGVVDNGEMLMLNPTRETPILYLVKGDGKEIFPISKGINSADYISQFINGINKHVMRLF
jgi:conjugal transfer pilus assembly protein TraF